MDDFLHKIILSRAVEGVVCFVSVRAASKDWEPKNDVMLCSDTYTQTKLIFVRHGGHYFLQSPLSLSFPRLPYPSGIL